MSRKQFSPIIVQADDDDGEQANGISGTGERPRPAGLAPNQVRLSDGRVVTVEETTEWHNKLVSGPLTQAGYSAAQDFYMYMRALALCSLDSIGRWDEETQSVVDTKPLMRPRTRLEVQERIQGFLSKDVLPIFTLYNELNGTGDSNSDSFR